MYSSPEPRSLARLFALAALVFAILVPIARAQEAVPATEPSGREAIEALQEQIDDIAAKLPAPTEEETRVLRVEIEKKREDVRAEIGSLMNRAEEDDELARFLLEALERNENGLRTSIARVEEDIQGLRDELDGASGEERLRIESQLTRNNRALDGLLEALAESIERRKRLRAEVGDQEKKLDEKLALRAETVAGLMRVTLGEIRALQERLDGVAEGEGGELRAELEAWNEKLRGTTESLQSLARVMDQRGLDTAEYRTLLIQATGKVTGDILDTEVALGLVEIWLRRAQAWLIESAPAIFFNCVLFVVILLAFWVIARIARRLVRRGVDRADVGSALLRHFLVGLASKTVIIVGILVALSQVGVNLGPMLAGLGIAGFIVGFALQDTLSNFASGLMILAYRPFDVGDVVEGGGVTGIVDTMSLVSTTIRTFDNQKLIVPNNKIWGDVIRNVTAQTTRRVDLVFGIDYGDDIAHAQRVLEEIIAEHPAVLDDPEPVIRLHTLGESSVDFVVRPWVKTADYWTVYWDVTRSVKERFDAEGISIPFPQRDIHVRTGGPDAGVRADQDPGAAPPPQANPESS